MANPAEIFGSMVFNEMVMRGRLPKSIFNEIKKAKELGRPLNTDAAEVIAAAMKDWAVEKGATHFTHWFQPMTNVTAEKHDSFISNRKDGTAIMEFSGKELVHGESDASSFPSGGLRATFEARGYTAWDPTSYAFVKDKTLYIPSAFYSYSGVALDKKTPLMRSMDALNVQVLRILKLFGHSAQRVTPTVGAEQEYFIVDKEMFELRRDLVFTGRTLFGARPPKGQELEDHYYGAIKPRIFAFMKELDEELWKLGIPAKTEHNEVAPAQHELALVYETANVATDHNQLTMELMKIVAARHGLVCLLHEKPFAGVNGSGKHNNWAIATDEGVNLLEPGETPYENAQFLLFLCAIIKAVDEYQDVLRLTVATAGNDHRLGGDEAPPAIISIFLGDELTDIMQAIEEEREYRHGDPEPIELGVSVLPKFPKDATDRNRTSPFAFTGNKFEFRMPGAPLSVAGPNIVLNTIVAESLRQYADELEQAEDFQIALNKLIRRTIKKHKRIVFNGNNYSEAWKAEAKARGLLHLPTAVDAIPCFASEKNIATFERHGVFKRQEIESRCEIMLADYVKKINIEALTMVEMAKREILPAGFAYQKDLASLALSKKQLGVSADTEVELLRAVDDHCARISALTEKLRVADAALREQGRIYDRAVYCKDILLPIMAELRVVADELETMCGKQYWLYPTYGKLLFNI